MTFALPSPGLYEQAFRVERLAIDMQREPVDIAFAAWMAADFMTEVDETRDGQRRRGWRFQAACASVRRLMAGAGENLATIIVLRNAAGISTIGLSTSAIPPTTSFLFCLRRIAERAANKN